MRGAKTKAFFGISGGYFSNQLVKINYIVSKKRREALPQKISPLLS